MGVHWPIIRTLATQPTRVLVTDDKRSYRGIDLLWAAGVLADRLEREGTGKHVGVMLPTSGAFPIAALAAWATGRVIVPLNYLLKPAELRYVVADSEVGSIVTIGPMLDFVGGAPPGPRVVRMDEMNFRSLPSPRVPALTLDRDLAALVYTSGTSGRPKGVMLSHAALAVNARQGAQGMELGPRDVMLGVLPQFHCYGMTQLTLTPLMHGIPVVYTARFAARKLIELVREHRATCLVGIPSMFNALAASKSGSAEDFASLRLVVSGSEALPDAVFDRFRERFGKPIHEGYGMTEMAPGTHCCLCGEGRKHSVGPPLPGVEQRIVDPQTEQDVPPGADGEVRLRGPNMMSGYWKLPAETRAAFDARGYYRTGDMGRVSEDGYLSITGRYKEMIIVGGENVFPREIEEVLDRHEAVHASGVTGVADGMRGEAPVAFVELEEGAEVEPRALLAWCREHLAGYKVPKAVHVVPALPRNPTGKIMRKELRSLLPIEEPASAR